MQPSHPIDSASINAPFKLVTGGQTGVDRAVLDAAMALSWPIGGWCPLGRRAEDGPIQAQYPLSETPSEAYAQRTAWNVRDSDATLILSSQPLTGGTAFTLACAGTQGKPVLVIDPQPANIHAVSDWILQVRPRVLNIAGPRASEQPNVYDQTHAFMLAMLSTFK